MLTKTQIEDAKRRYMNGETTYAIAADYGITGPSVAYWLKKSGVILRSKGTTSGLSWDQKVEKVQECYLKGMRTREVAKKLGISTSTISGIHKQLSLPSRVKRKKLTPSQREELVRRYKARETYADLSKVFLVSPCVIKSALNEAGVKPRNGWTRYRTVSWEDSKGRSHVFKSTWELAFAKHLDARDDVDRWEYEERSFYLPQRRCYTPDFFVYSEDGKLLSLVEVHGWLDDPTKERLEEFVQVYPKLPFKLLGPGEMSALGLISSEWATHHQAEQVTRFRNKLLSYNV